MPSLTVGILASNNADEIADCLGSVPWADALLVILDTRSSDGTAEIARSLGAQVVSHAFEDFARQREFGLTLVETDWLFYLDSDERGTPELGAELHSVMQKDSLPGWWIPRRNYILGKEIRHGGWHPDYQLRMLKLGWAHYDLTRPVHEVVCLEGEAGYLKQPLIHYNYRTLAQFIRKQRQYVVYEAEMRYEGGARAKPWTLVLQPLREFWRRYFVLKGYRDGLHGLLLCSLVAYYYGLIATIHLARLPRQRGK